MQDETLITLKDILIPCFSILVAGVSVYLSYRQMRLQIKKNMRVQHIDRFRDTMTEIIAIFFLANIKDLNFKIEKFNTENLMLSFSRAIIILDTRKARQKELATAFLKYIMFFHTEGSSSIKATEMIPDLFQLIQAAIQELEDEI
jgi:hypothetical protein